MTQIHPHCHTKYISQCVATATTATYPLDLIRARMAAHWSKTPRYSSFLQGAREIIKQEGFVSLYGGITPTLLGIVPYAGISFAIFETLKAIVEASVVADVSTHDSNTEQHSSINNHTKTALLRLGCGCVAGVIVQWGHISIVLH